MRQRHCHRTRRDDSCRRDLPSNIAVFTFQLAGFWASLGGDDAELEGESVRVGGQGGYGVAVVGAKAGAIVVATGTAA
jgi:hypothetical protein